jgi:hypothetical protein
MMKFLTEEGVGEIKGDQLATRRCYNISIKKVSDPTTLTVASVTEVKGEPVEPLRGSGRRRRKSPTDWDLSYSKRSEKASWVSFAGIWRCSLGPMNICRE